MHRKSPQMRRKAKKYSQTEVCNLLIFNKIKFKAKMRRKYAANAPQIFAFFWFLDILDDYE